MKATIRKVRSFWYVINEYNEVVGLVNSKKEAERYIERMDTLRRADEIDFDDMFDKLLQVFDGAICEKGYEFQEWNEAEWIVNIFRRVVPEAYKFDEFGTLYLCGNGWRANVTFEDEKGHHFYNYRAYSECETVYAKMHSFDDFGYEASEFLKNCESFGFTFDDYRKRFRANGKKLEIIGFQSGNVLIKLAEGKKQFVASVEDVKSCL